MFGIYAPGTDVARVAFFALYALQHRGQESAGIATSDGVSAAIHKDMGLVAQVFTEDDLSKLEGHLAVGQTRYSTTGSSHLRNAQPYLIETMHGPLGVGHNGNLTNAPQLRNQLLERGVGLTSSTDSEVITQMLAAPAPGTGNGLPDWEARIGNFMAEAEGAYSLVVLTRDAVFGVRDPHGFRPLCIGRLEDGGYVVASESCALGTVGASFVREVEPGEIIRLDKEGMHSVPGPVAPEPALCVFEYVYFARPDSVFEGQTIHRVRQRLGEVLAAEAPADADLVVGVPDSATPAAIGYAIASGIPYTEGLIKNRYIGRTFIMPGQQERRKSVRQKLNAIDLEFKDKNVLLVDDSIVRGTTSQQIIQMARDAGARKVYFASAAPPVRYPNVYGIDMPAASELIANSRSVDEIQELIGADKLIYQDLHGLIRSVRHDNSSISDFDTSCFSGEYVTGDVTDDYLDALEAKRNDAAKQRLRARQRKDSGDTGETTNVIAL